MSIYLDLIFETLTSHSERPMILSIHSSRWCNFKTNFYVLKIRLYFGGYLDRIYFRSINKNKHTMHTEKNILFPLYKQKQIHVHTENNILSKFYEQIHDTYRKEYFISIL